MRDLPRATGTIGTIAEDRPKSRAASAPCAECGAMTRTGRSSYCKPCAAEIMARRHAAAMRERRAEQKKAKT